MAEDTATASVPVPSGDGPVGRRARTAARLREAGLAAFGELGWSTVRVEDVVRHAGVSHGTFYTYYENKAALLDDLVRASQAEFVALAADAWEADDVRGALERVIAGFLDVYRRDAVIMRTWLDAAREEPGLAELYLTSRALFVRRVAEELDKMLARRARGAPPAATVASALVAMVEHFAYCWLVLGEPHERNDAVDALVTIWGGALNELAGFEVVSQDAGAR